jgi:O-antigen/teichoic acid export membrane protein
MFRQLLSANQRNDLTAYIEITGLLVALIVLGIGFYCGLGLWSLVVSSAVGLVIVTAIQAWLCVKLRIMPAWRGGRWFNREMFIEIWNYAKDRFFVSFGQRTSQLAPQLLITPLFGLQSATIWSAGIKVFNLLQQLVWKVMDLAYPALAEMLARKEFGRLKERYRQLYQLSLAFSFMGAIFLLGINSLFIDVWLHGKVVWPEIYNVLLVVWLLVGSVSQITCDYIILTRTFGFFRWIAYIEAIVAVIIIYMLSAWFPAVISIITGMVVASLSCTIPYALKRMAGIQQIRVIVILRNWLFPVILRGLPWLLAGIVITVGWVKIHKIQFYGQLALIVVTLISALCCAFSQPSVREIIKMMWLRYGEKIRTKVRDAF